MDISKLYEMQKALDERIVKEKGLEGQNLLPNTVLALQVEIGELANEWRGFKHWSNNREPRTRVKTICHACRGNGKFVFPNEEDEICLYCGGTGVQEDRNPLLEEYVDCLHFFLSIAHQKNWPNSIYVSEEAIEDIRESGFEGGITGAFIEMQYWLLKSYMENNPNPIIEEKLGYTTKEFYFRNAFFIFLALGLVGFGFTWDQISEAYVAKNKINHERQSNGY